MVSKPRYPAQAREQSADESYVDDDADNLDSNMAPMIWRAPSRNRAFQDSDGLGSPKAQVDLDGAEGPGGDLESRVRDEFEDRLEDAQSFDSEVPWHPLGDDLVLELTEITKTYGQADRQIHVLRGANLTIEPGQILGLIGPSGSGKTTLLQIAGLLDVPTSGTVTIVGAAAESLRDRARTLLRRDTVGFVYQFHHLLKEFNALENVMMPQRVAGVPQAQARKRAIDLLVRVGLQDRLAHRPAMLSGGEQQRVALARGLANRPALLLADEPTGNLDPDTAESVFQMLLTLTREEGMAALIATHNLDLGDRMDRRVRLERGLLYEA